MFEFSTLRVYGVLIIGFLSIPWWVTFNVGYHRNKYKIIRKGWILNKNLNMTIDCK